MLNSPSLLFKRKRPLKCNMMHQLKVYIFLAPFVILPALSSKYYSGENRPYKFGYKIDQNQHRYEQKDENGIIMGEFGFITADGVYHITIYATDENGNFKILSMKNIKVKKDPPSTTTTARPTTKMSSSKLQRRPAIARACSGCLIPSMVTMNENDIETPNRNRINTNDNVMREKPIKKIYKDSKGKKIYGHAVNIRHDTKPEVDKSVSRVDQTLLPPLRTENKKVKSQTVLPSGKSADVANQKPIEALAKEQSSIGILYRFNYSLALHEHAEQGDVGGNKNGTYSIIGEEEDRNLTYLANENGFQPFIKLHKNPKDSELYRSQSANNTLRGYEFIWFN